MSQDDLIVNNADGATVRADINAQLQALGSLMSGATEPSTKYAYMFWGDTTLNLLKQRNSANTAWLVRITLAELFVITKTTAYTVLVADFRNTILCSTSGGIFTITLPAVATAGDGFEVTIMKTDSSVNKLTIDGNGSETINGALTLVLATQYDSVILRCDGISWYVVSNTDLTTLKVSTDFTLKGGYAGIDSAEGTFTSGTYTPVFTGGNFKTIVHGAGGFAIGVAAETSTIITVLVNASASGSVTTAGYDAVDGDTIDNIGTNRWMLFSTRTGGMNTLFIKADSGNT